MADSFFDKTDRQRLMLIDGNSLINRAYYGLMGRQMLTAPDGTPSGAIFTFLNMYLNYGKLIEPDLICVAFDRPTPTFRHQMYTEYKGTRRAMPDDLAVQIPLLKEMLRALKIKQVELDGYEADDLIGSYAMEAEREGYDVFIVTGDKDSFQLVRDHIFVVLPVTRQGSKTDDLIDRQQVLKEFTIEPEQMIDLKAIMGDASDNIPGVKGIGLKGGMKLINQFGDLDGVYANLEQIAAGQRAKLSAARETAYLSKELATIHVGAPRPFKLTELRRVEPDNQLLLAFFEKMGFHSMLERFDLKVEHDLADQIPWDRLREYENLSLFLHELRGEPLVWLQFTEQSHLLLAPQSGYCVVDSAQILDTWQQLDRLTNLIIVWDYKYLLRTTRLKPLRHQVFDLKIAAYILNQGNNTNFAAVYHDVFGQLLPEYELNQLDRQKETRQLIEHAWAMRAVERAQRVQIRDWSLECLSYDIEMPLSGILAAMEALGVAVDRDKMHKLSDALANEQKQLEEQILAYAAEPFNLNSSKMLSDFLFNQLSLPAGKKLASGYFSTAAGELERLSGMHPVIELILEFREVSKLRSTFVEGLSKAIDPTDGRIHTTYHQTLTTTGRISSSDPNLQNIPIRSDRSKLIRNVFVAPRGKILIGADYSQIELRLLAHLSNDPHLIEAFRENQDIHNATASKMFGLPEDEINVRQRNLAKTVNFSIVYGVTPFGLAQDLKASVEEANQYIEAYYQLYDQVKPYLETLIEKVKQDGYVETMFGRRRYIPEIKSGNFHTRQFGERAAMNAPLQGSAADIIKLAMIRIHERLNTESLDARLILQVHDELILESPEEEAETVARLLKEEMENVLTLRVPLIANVSVGRSWSEMK